MEMERGWGMWGSVNNGCFFCMNCSGRHRSIGVHLSFVRSTVQDDWKREQLRSMEMGGNGALLDFWKQNGVDSELPITEKYGLLPSVAYRMILKATADDREPVPSREAALAAAEWMLGPGKWDNKAALERAIEQTKANPAPKSKPKSKPKGSAPKISIPKADKADLAALEAKLAEKARKELELEAQLAKYENKKKAKNATRAVQSSGNPIAMGQTANPLAEPVTTIAANPLAEPVPKRKGRAGEPACGSNPLITPPKSIERKESAGLTEIRMGGSLNFSALASSKNSSKGRSRSDTVDSMDALCAQVDERARGESTISMGSLDGLCEESDIYGSPRDRDSSLTSLNEIACGSMGHPGSPEEDDDSDDSMDALCEEADVSMADSAASLTSRDRCDSSGSLDALLADTPRVTDTTPRNRTNSVDSIDRLLMETPREHQAYLASHRSMSSDDDASYNRDRGDSVASMNSIDFLCADADNSPQSPSHSRHSTADTVDRSESSDSLDFLETQDSKHSRQRSIDSIDELCAEADEWKSPSESMPYGGSMDDFNADTFGEGIEPLHGVEPSPEISTSPVVLRSPNAAVRRTSAEPASSLDQF